MSIGFLHGKAEGLSQGYDKCKVEVLALCPHADFCRKGGVVPECPFSGGDFCKIVKLGGTSK